MFTLCRYEQLWNIKAIENEVDFKAVLAAKSSFFLFTYNWISVLGTEQLSPLCCVIIFIEKWETVAKTSNHMIRHSFYLLHLETYLASRVLLSLLRCRAIALPVLLTASELVPISVLCSRTIRVWLGTTHGQTCEIVRRGESFLVFCFVLKFIMSKVLPYVSDALFDTLDFSDFPQLFNYFF